MVEVKLSCSNKLAACLVALHWEKPVAPVAGTKIIERL